PVGVDDVQVADRSFAILNLGQLGGPRGLVYRGVLHLGLFAQDPQAGQSVFNFAKSLQHRLAIRGHVLFVSGAGTLYAGFTAAAVENRQGQRRTDQWSEQKSSV